jgi:hypothetical protein
MPKVSDPHIDSLPKERAAIVVGKVKDIEIVRPKTLALPLTEGSHLQVRREGVTKPWTAEPVKSVLTSAFFSLPAAKATRPVTGPS